MTQKALALTLAAAVLATATATAGLCPAGSPEAAALPEGCRGGVTLFCADPSWPAAENAPRPATRLTAKVAPVTDLAK